MDDATYYEQHKDDSAEWGEPVHERPRRRLASMISIRVSPEEHEQIRHAAEEVGESVSSFVRSAALDRSAHVSVWAISASASFTYAGSAIAAAAGTVSLPVQVKGLARTAA